MPTRHGGETVEMELRAILHDTGPGADACWRSWAHRVVDAGVDAGSLLRMWTTVLDFDPALAEAVASPWPLPEPVVVVGGSGKEDFKTFNVSTAAVVLAAAAGARIVKGVSRSVSAVSGAQDVLGALGIPQCATRASLAAAVETHGVGFVPYEVFCPRYAARYDGVFTFLNPFSFFMPVAVLGVSASAFVLGLAHPSVSEAARAIVAARPEMRSGVVVASELSPGEFVDEHAPVGRSYTARAAGGTVSTTVGGHRSLPPDWRSRVAQRTSHADNATMVVDALRPDGSGPASELVEANAAQILATARSLNTTDAAAAVRDARLSGRAIQLLDQLRDSTTGGCDHA